MNALILAAGLGTRLRPLTNHCPKAMVEVAGRPMLEQLILKLKRSGFTHIVVNVHHYGEQIIDFLQANHNFGLQIEVSDERGLLLDTGGGIRRGASFFTDGQPILVHNVDVFCNLDFKDMFSTILSKEAEALLLVAERETSRMLYFDDNSRLKGWQNRNTGEQISPFPCFNPQQLHPLAFNGIHVITPSLVARMKSQPESFPIIPFYLSVAKESTLYGYQPLSSFEWVDAGKPEALERASWIVQQYY